jgi:predicted SprT family Zn-dependent metalloprotease
MRDDLCSRSRIAAKRAPSALTQPALKLIVRAYLRRMGEEQRAPRVRVVFYQRLRTAIGRSDPSRGRIYLNPRLLDRYPQELVPTLVHELCHVVAGLRAGHGPRWKELMERCGFVPDVYHDLDVSEFSVRRRSWYWSCRKCGERYLRKTRAAARYRCADCGGGLRVEDVSRRAALDTRPRQKNR